MRQPTNTFGAQSRSAVRSCGRRFGSALRFLALALMLLGASSTGVFADHMGNHERGPAESVTETSGGLASQECGAGVAGGSSSNDTDRQDELAARPFRSSPW